MPSQEAIRAAFALFDRDGDGLLSPDELKTIMCRAVPRGVQRTEAEVDALVRRLDKDGDNKLSMEEMAEAWAELGLAPMITAAAMEKAAAEFERQFAKARAAQEAPTNDAQHFGQQFNLLTPMLGMPFGVFKKQRRIIKSTASSWLGAAPRGSAMGCGASNASQRDPALTSAALRFGQQFDLLTPMLVMPFGVFKAQGRIMKSIKVWRDQALAAGSLVVHEEGSGKVAIFVSHTWWDRGFKDATNDPNNPYDQGAPDWQKDYPDDQRKDQLGRMFTYQRSKDLKWRIICAGVQRLIEQEGLQEEDVSLWVDWQSIYQDDETEKLKGVKSLIRYATLCQFMLVPTEEAELRGGSPVSIPAYGSRGWCRVEYFVFGLLAEMQGHEVQLYAILLNGALNRYPKVVVMYESYMPSGGALANPNDKALVKGLEDKMIEAYGTALVEVKCKAAGGKKVDLSRKILRPQHVGALFAAVERYQGAELYLCNNQLGAAGGALVAAGLKTNTTFTYLSLKYNNLGPEGGMAIAEALKKNKTLKTLILQRNKLGPAGGMAVAEALKENTTLKKLWLDDNGLGSAAKQALKAAARSGLDLRF